MRALRRLRSCRAGSTAVEFAIICMALLLVTFGVIEFGRGLYVRNQLSQAADCGERLILTGAVGSGCGPPRTLTGLVSDSELQSAVRSAFTAGTPGTLTVTVSTGPVNGLQFRTITLSYPFTPLIPQLASGVINLSVARRSPVI
jgi:Flp pilus assembly protein TadG